MALISPSQYETLPQLRAAMRNGGIREYRGFIAAVKIDGADIGDALPRGVSGSITYSVGLTDIAVGIPDSSLEDLVPSNRVASNVRVIGPRRFTPCKMVVIEIPGRKELKFYPQESEQIDVFNCDGVAVLEVV